MGRAREPERGRPDRFAAARRRVRGPRRPSPRRRWLPWVARAGRLGSPDAVGRPRSRRRADRRRRATRPRSFRRQPPAERDLSAERLLAAGMVDDQLRRAGHRRRARARGDGTRAARALRPRGRGESAYADAALPIGHEPDDLAAVHGRAHLRGLALTGRERVLDVGTGSGYQAAVLAELARKCTRSSGSPSSPSGAEEPRGRRVRARRGPRRRRLGRPARSTRRSTRSPSPPPRPSCPQPLYDQLEPRGRLVVPVGGPLGPAPRAHRPQPGGARGRPLGAVPLRAARRRGRLRGVKRALVVVRGPVQGVFFRVETRDRAAFTGPRRLGSQRCRRNRRGRRSRETTSASTRWSSGAGADARGAASTTSTSPWSSPKARTVSRSVERFPPVDRGQKGRADAKGSIC